MAFFTIRTFARTEIVEAADATAAVIAARLSDEEINFRRAPKVSPATCFDSLVAAEDAFSAVTDELDYVDNYRFAYVDDAAAMDAYNRQADAGCCGSVDSLVVVAGRPAMFGCNYGH